MYVLAVMLPIPEPLTAPDLLEKAVDAAEQPLKKKRITCVTAYHHHILTTEYTITLTLDSLHLNPLLVKSPAPHTKMTGF